MNIDNYMDSTSTSDSTSSDNDSRPDCAHNQGETSCGSICCAAGQYCAYEGQCEISTLKNCSTSLGLTSCGSICCENWQICVSSGQCGDGTGETTAMSASTPAIYPSMAATFGMTSPTSSTVKTSSVTAQVTSSIVPTSDRSATVSSSDGNLTALESATTEIPSSPPSPILSSANTTADITMSDHPISAPTPTTFSASSPSSSVTSKTRFKVGVAVGVVGVAVIAFIVFIIYRRRRDHRTRHGGTTDVSPPSEETSDNVHQFRPADYGLTAPPIPSPYDERFPQNPTPFDSPGLTPIRRNSLGFNSDLTPDHDIGDRRPLNNLRHAPALDPYRRNFPAPTQRGSLRDDESQSSTIPPSYRS